LKVPFIGQAYQTRSPVGASQTAINIFPELMQGNSDEVGAFYGTPGLANFVTPPLVATVRALHECYGYLFVVIGNSCYRMATTSDPFFFQFLGTIPNTIGPVTIVNNETQIVFCHPSGWDWCLINTPGPTLTPVVGAPNNSVASYQDQYLLYVIQGTGFFGVSNAGDLSTLDPTMVADAEGQPDNLVNLISDHGEVALIGEETIEVWTNTGGAFFPFQKLPGTFIEMGCIAPASVAKGANSIFLLGRDKTGKAIVFQSSGYNLTRISTHPIEYAIASYGDVSDAIGWVYQEEGHIFYQLTFPGGDATWVYDVATRSWHRRGWLDDEGILHRHRANCYANFGPITYAGYTGSHIVGDFENGMLYLQSMNIYTDNGDPIYRERAFDLPDSENKRIRLDKFEVLATIGDGDPSGDPVKLWLQISRDAGRTWGYQRIVTTGAIGQTYARARWRRIGSARNPVLRIATTMENRVNWVAGYLEGEQLGV